MDEEKALEQALQKALLTYGLSEQRALSIALRTTELARRSKKGSSVHHPGILIEDHYREGRGITIVIRTNKLPNYKPREILDDYLARCKYPGEWFLKEAFGYTNPKVRAWVAKPTTVTNRKAEKTEKDLLKNFARLSPEKQKEVLANLRNG